MYDRLKRFFDFLLASIVIIILLPLFIPISIVLRFTGEGEIFYFQERVGLANKDFKIYKFATMLKDSEKLGRVFILQRMMKEYCHLGDF